MSPEAVVAMVARLHVAGGLHPPGEIDYETWGEALNDVGDDEANDAATTIIKTVDLGAIRPTPAMIRHAVRDKRRRSAQRQLPLVQNVTPKPEGAVKVRRLKSKLAATARWWNG